jgi:hypothetical protein
MPIQPFPRCPPRPHSLPSSFISLN